MKRLVTLWALTCVLTFSFAGPAAAHSFSARVLSDVHVGKSKPELKAQMAYSNYVLDHFKSKQNHWRLLPRHATCWSHVQSKTLRHVCNAARTRFTAHRWLYSTAKAKYDRLYVPKVPVISGNGGEFECIHGYEGAWNSNTGNGYYGGLQMDLGFQGTYGREFIAQWGTADNWPVWAQVVAARRARDGYGGYPARGYSPWPNTARACGMLS